MKKERFSQEKQRYSSRSEKGLMSVKKILNKTAEMVCNNVLEYLNRVFPNESFYTVRRDVDNEHLNIFGYKIIRQRFPIPQKVLRFEKTQGRDGIEVVKINSSYINKEKLVSLLDNVDIDSVSIASIFSAREELVRQGWF